MYLLGILWFLFYFLLDIILGDYLFHMNHMFLLEELLNMFDSPQYYVPLLTKCYRKKVPSLVLLQYCETVARPVEQLISAKELHHTHCTCTFAYV